MSGKGIFATIAMLLIAASVQDMAPAQGAPNYQANQPGLNVKVPPYAFNKRSYRSAANAFARGQLSAVHDVAAEIRSRRQRTLNQNSFITQELNLEGYPRGTGTELRRFSDE